VAKKEMTQEFKNNSGDDFEGPSLRESKQSKRGEPAVVAGKATRATKQRSTEPHHLEFDPFEKIWKVLSIPIVSRIAIGATAFTLGGGAVLIVGAKEAYDYGLIEAKKVAAAADEIKMLPIYSETEPPLEAVAYIQKRPFVRKESQAWNKDSVAHPASPNEMRTQSDYVAWNIPPVSVQDVQKDGPLYLTRLALTVLEDRSLEDGTGFDIKGFFRPLISGFSAGGSTLSAQLCGDLWDQTGAFLPHSKIAESGFETQLSYKLSKTACGVALASEEVLSVDEIVANYLTYSYFGGANTHGALQFAQSYWGIEKLSDPSLTEGRKLILAALPKRPFSTKKDPQKTLESWYLVVDRALYAAQILRAENKITAEQKVKIDTQLKKERDNPPVRSLPNRDFEFVSELVAAEASDHKADEDWIHKVDGLVVSINEELQHSLPGIVRKGLQAQGDSVRGTVLVTNERGEYVGVYTGSKRGLLSNVEMKTGPQTAINRLSTPLSPASVGKLIVAAALAEKGIRPSPVDQALKRHTLEDKATWDVIYSNDDLIEHAVALGVNEALVKKLVKCFGTWRPNVTAGSVAVAVTGNWEISPEKIPAYLYAFATGEVLPKPHVITGAWVGDHVDSVTFPKEKQAEDCAKSMYQDGKSYAWGELPLYGTMSKLHKPTQLAEHGLIGKTGTVGEKEKNTQVVWAPFSAQFKDGERFMVSTTVWAERRNIKNKEVAYVVDMGFNFGSSTQASTIALPISDQVLYSLALHH
jgi:hypothetical protein